MSFVIKWKKNNPDGVVTGYSVFRSAQKENVYAAENKIVDVGPSVFEFTDNDAQPGSKYYYGIRSHFGDNYKIDGFVVMIAQPVNYGHGGVFLVHGTHELGLYDRMEQSAFPIGSKFFNTIQERIGLANLAVPISPSPYAYSTVRSDWDKISYNGDILFIPMAPFLSIVNGISKAQVIAVLNLITDVNNPIIVEYSGERYKLILASPQIAEKLFAPTHQEFMVNVVKTYDLITLPLATSSTNFNYFYTKNAEPTKLFYFTISNSKVIESEYVSGNIYGSLPVYAVPLGSVE